MKSTVENISFWRSACVHWNRNTDKAEVPRSKIRQFLWLLNFLLHLGHVAFLVIRYIQFNYIKESATTADKIYTEYGVVAYIVPVVFHMCIYFRLDDLVDLLNEYSRFYLRCCCRYFYRLFLHFD